MSSGHREMALRAHARAQHGVFTLAQALTSGFSRATIRRLVACGAWAELAPRTYRVALSADADWRAMTMAEVLSTGGIACRRSALALFELWKPPPEPEVLAMRNARTAARLPQRSTNCLPAIDVTYKHGVPLTTPARTLIDMGGRLPLPLFEDILDTAVVQRLVTLPELDSRARALWAPRRNGCAVVLRLLDERTPDVARAANLWEAKVLRVVRQLGLPKPKVNHRVRVGGRTRYLDLAWPEARVAVEFDGFVPHSKRRVFDDDRARQNDLVADGWTVFRITKAMLDTDLGATFRPIACAIGAER